MTLTDTPLRLLVKTYANGLLDRKQYLEIRSQLLKKLARQGSITHDDLQNFLSLHRGTDEPSAINIYTASDWIIIILGLLAAVVLGLVLYG